jgi:hypothetical protein
MPAAVGSPPRRLALVFRLALLLLAAPPAGAVQDIEPDRPDVSVSPGTVPAGSVQVETGLAAERESRGGRPDERRVAVEAALRLGLTERLELRLEGEPFVRLRGDGEDRGPGDVRIGAKYRLLDGDERRPALGLLGTVTLPVGEEPTGAERPQYALVGTALFALPGDVSLVLNAGVAAIGRSRPSGYLVQGFGTAEVQADLWAQRLEAYAELFGSTPEERGGRERIGAGAGLVFRLAPRLAIDAGVETTVAGSGPEWAVRAGVSARFRR